MKKQRYKATSTLNVGTMVQGIIGENKVANLFLKNGYIVTRPDVDLGVDMVVCKPKKWGKRTLINNWKSIQVKYSTRMRETSYGHSLLVKVTPNHCDYIAVPLENNGDNVIFYPQPEKQKGTLYYKEFAFVDPIKAKSNGSFKNQNKRRFATDFYILPK